jgi:hypothetical protein
MNYEVLLLLCLIYILPLAIIYRRFVKENEKIDEEYRKYMRNHNERW